MAFKQGKRIKSLYTRAGLTPPKGKGIHTIKYHKCVVAIKSKGGKNAKYANAICMKSIGRNEAVNKSHQRKQK
jgi:hypothetical protein